MKRRPHRQSSIVNRQYRSTPALIGNDQSTIHNPQSTIPILLLCLAAFLAPLIGGTISTDGLPLEPGYSPLMKAIFGGPEVPFLSHFVIALLVCAAAAMILASRRVIQVPMPLIGIPIVSLFGIVAVSSLFSSFPAVSIPTGLEWAVYGIAAFAAVAALGRKTGPTALLGSLFAGCVLLAILGVSEYFFGTQDPNWRIFATWQHPNALAGMLLIGFFAGVGLTLNLEKVAGAAAGAGSALIAFALTLTQSKGAFLAGGIGLCVAAVLAVIWLKRRGALLSLGRIAAIVAALAGMLLLLRMRSGEAAAPSPIARIQQASATQEQSAGFRTLLWKSAVRLMAERPQGWGPGGFRFESARPGLVTQTHLAHNSYLQLGAESGWVSLALFVGLAGFWLIYALKGATRLDSKTAALRVGLFSALVASAAHSFVDSDLHMFGSGLAFFLLVGTGLQLSADGVTPESVQPGPRWPSFAGCLLAPLVLLYFGSIEATRAHFRHDLAKGDFEAAREGAKTLTEMASFDGESWYALAQVTQPGPERIEVLKRAARQAPVPRILRSLAREQQGLEQYAGAEITLQEALVRDPNNLYTLKALLELHIAAKNEAEAIATARRLVAVENTTYFTTRALPELVPTETYEARIYLAKTTASSQLKAALLEPALEGLLGYATRTVPNIKSAIDAGLPGYGGETDSDARRKLGLGKSVASALEEAYRDLGKPSAARGAAAKAAELDRALSVVGD